LRPALEQARRLGVSGIEIDAAGELSPPQLSQTARRELRNLLRNHHLDITALCCPLRHGLDVAERQQERIDHIKGVLALSYDLGPRKVIVQAGKLPEKDDDPRRPLLSEALLALGRHGDRMGAVLALESGLDAAETVTSFLGCLDTGSLAVNFNPGKLLLGGHNAVSAARTLGRHIVHAHATDARAAAASRVPLGQGNIDWFELAAVLEEIGYHGWLVVETGPGTAPEAAAGVAFLRRVGIEAGHA